VPVSHPGFVRINLKKFNALRGEVNLRPSGYEPDDRIEIDGDSNISGVPLEQLKRSSRRTIEPG